jgi:hypothetical protein
MTAKKTETEAREWVNDHSDDDTLDREDLVASWEALHGRKLDTDDADDDATLWSECVNAVEAICPECGDPVDGSSGHGTCDNPCHQRA